MVKDITVGTRGFSITPSPAAKLLCSVRLERRGWAGMARGSYSFVPLRARRSVCYLKIAEHPLHTERLLVANAFGSESRRPVNEVVRRLRGSDG